MGVWDRDYSKADHGGAGGSRWHEFLPPRGALALIGLHVLGFLVVTVVRHDSGPAAATMFALTGSASHPAAIVLHPLGVRSLWTLALIVYVIWVLGGRIEARCGTGRLLALYALGTAISGPVYFGFAQMSPDLARYPLAAPAGALAAWVLLAWRELSDEFVSIFGWLTTFAKAAALGAGVVAALVFFKQAEGATGWLIAAAAGTLAAPIVNGLRGRAGVARARREARPPRRAAAGSVPEDPPIDDILTKISREGLDALTPAERERLEAARRAKLRGSR